MPLYCLAPGLTKVLTLGIGLSLCARAQNTGTVKSRPHNNLAVIFMKRSLNTDFWVWGSRLRPPHKAYCSIPQVQQLQPLCRIAYFLQIYLVLVDIIVSYDVIPFPDLPVYILSGV